MFNENAIDKLITPFINRQTQINEVTLKKIAERLKDISTMSPSDVHKLERILRSGADTREITKEISRLSNLQVREIKQIIKTIAEDTYEDARYFYKAKGLPYIPFEENIELQQILSAVQKETANTYMNISKTAAYAVRDATNPSILRYTNPAKTYQNFVDMAIQSVVLGVDPYNIAIQRGIMSLIGNGLQGKVQYETEEGKVHYRRLDSAVRQNVLDGIRAVNQRIDLETGKQFGSDGVEISVHMMPADDHAPIQGHSFTNKEFEKMQNGQSFKDVLGNHFSGMERPIGVWNCRHIAMSVLLKEFTPNYTPQQLQEILDKNQKGYTYKDKNGNDKHLTMYECSQKRNNYELKLKELKEGKAFAEKAGNTKLAEKYDNKFRNTRSNYLEFCKRSGLKPRLNKVKIYM